MKRVRAVFPIVLIHPRSDAQYVVLDGVSRVMVAGMVDLSFVVSGVSERDDPYRSYLVVGIDSMANP